MSVFSIGNLESSNVFFNAKYKRSYYCTAPALWQGFFISKILAAFIFLVDKCYNFKEVFRTMTNHWCTYHKYGVYQGHFSSRPMTKHCCTYRYKIIFISIISSRPMTKHWCTYLNIFLAKYQFVLDLWQITDVHIIFKDRLFRIKRCIFITKFKRSRYCTTSALWQRLFCV